MASSMPRTVDGRGRVTLGRRFANRSVLVEKIDETAVRVTLARVIPEREAWLYANPEARASVERGLQQAAAREFSKNPPDLEADAAFAEQLDDD